MSRLRCVASWTAVVLALALPARAAHAEDSLARDEASHPERSLALGSGVLRAPLGDRDWCGLGFSICGGPSYRFARNAVLTLRIGDPALGFKVSFSL